MLGERESVLVSLGYQLDVETPESRLFDSLVIVDQMVYFSGQVPYDGENLPYVGKVPLQVSEEQAIQAAGLCTANILRRLRREIGSLDQIERIVRVTGYVNSEPDYDRQHVVLHGASKLLRAVFGEAGRHARTAIGVAQLPLGVAVEVEMILLLKKDFDSTRLSSSEEA